MFPFSLGNNILHLDEFLWELLDNSKYVGYIQWTSKDKLEFKIVKPMMVANLWGIRKNKKRMTYEKLARGIRYYKKSGDVERIPDRNFHFRFTGKYAKYKK